MDERLMGRIKEIVQLARKVDKTENKATQKSKKDNWYLQAAKDMDLMIDDDLLETLRGASSDDEGAIHHEDGSSRKKKNKTKAHNDLLEMKHKLRAMIKEPLVKQNVARGYFTTNSNLPTYTEIEKRNGELDLQHVER